MGMLKKPAALRPGQTIGLVAPSFALPEPELLPKAVDSLEALGYRVKVGDCCLSRHGYFAGDDAARAGEINRMFRDDSVDAIMCVRGGYGATRILPLLDYNAIRANPKVFSGSSDVTALHSALLTSAGLVAFHGLMAVSDFSHEENDAFSLDTFWQVVGSTRPGLCLQNPPAYPTRSLVDGRARGPLIGGNLSLVASCIGTPYAYEFDGAILFLEDVSERTYVVDRLLTQLANAGVFRRVAGVVLGEFTKCDPRKNMPHDFTMDQVLADIFAACEVPVLSGLRCGHVTPKLSLPFGIECELDTKAGAIRLLENAVV